MEGEYSSLRIGHEYDLEHSGDVLRAQYIGSVHSQEELKFLPMRFPAPSFARRSGDVLEFYQAIGKSSDRLEVKRISPSLTEVQTGVLKAELSRLARGGNA